MRSKGGESKVGHGVGAESKGEEWEMIDLWCQAQLAGEANQSSSRT